MSPHLSHCLVHVLVLRRPEPLPTPGRTKKCFCQIGVCEVASEGIQLGVRRFVVSEVMILLADNRRRVD